MEGGELERALRAECAIETLPHKGTYRAVRLPPVSCGLCLCFHCCCLPPLLLLMLQVRDLWLHADVGSTLATEYNVSVPANGSATLLRFIPVA